MPPMGAKPAYVSRGSDYWGDVKARLQEEEIARLKAESEAATIGTESVLGQVVQVLSLLRVSTDLFAGAMHRFEDRAQEERNEIARVLDLARRIDIRLGVALRDHPKGDPFVLGPADSIFVGNEAGEGVNFGFPPGRYRARVVDPARMIVIEREG